MSGAEFIAIAGVISSIIAIVEGVNQVVDAASEVEGLPKAFRQASNKLPLVSDILEATKHNFGADDVSGVEKSVALVINSCKDKWETLRDLFDKVIPEEKASRIDRYYKAVKTLGKGGKVESLMKGILEDIQLLATVKTMTTMNVEKVIKTVTAMQEEKVAKAITDVAAWPLSVPDEVFQDRTYTNNNYGSGQQYISQGDAKQNIFQDGAKQFNSGGGSQTINEAPTFNYSIFELYPLQRRNEDEAQACLVALFRTHSRDDREKLIQTKGPRVVGTCEWIKTNALYNSWLRSDSQLLWLSGGPGKGKTMLSIFLAEELERTTKSLQNSLFLQYFCDNKDEKRNTAVGIILGLLFQLLELQPKLFHYILPEFKIQGESLFDNSSFPTLWGIFETMLRDPVLSNVYCILDGLDECDAALLEDLLKKFSSLFPTKSRQSLTCHLKLIIVSRELPKFISTTLQDFPRIRLDPDADSEVYYDILRFIDVKVDELSSSCSIQHPEPRVHIRNVFRDRAQGTFLWVALAAKALEECKATEITAYLDVFPPGLDYLYARLLLQINVDRRETAAKILRWVVMAVRPLTLSELSAVVDIPFKPATCFEPNEAMRDQVSNCGYFLTIKDDEVSLIHQSAKEYLLHKSKLEDFRVKEEVGNLEIATKCFYYLQELARWDSEVHLKDTTLLKEFPFLSYAILHWPEHARFLARSESIFDLSTPFYSNKSQIPMSWIKAYCDIRGEAGPPHSYTLLHLASYFGILPLAENLLLKKRSINIVMRFLYVNKRDSFGRAPLHLAAWEGHEAVVRLLLEKGADTNAKDRQGGTALCWAAPRGHEAVIRLLLEKGADIEAKYMSGGKTALASAAWEGHEAVVRLLLEKGANIEAKDISDEKTALVFAASAGHEAVVRLLLEKGADIEAKNISDEKTALVFAVWGGYNAVVQLLLEKGANVEAKCQLVTGILDFVLCFDP